MWVELIPFFMVVVVVEGFSREGGKEEPIINHRSRHTWDTLRGIF